MSPETLGYIILALWLFLNGYALASDINPWKDRPVTYVIVGLFMEIAVIWLALKAVL